MREGAEGRSAARVPEVEAALFLGEQQFRRLLDKLPVGAYTCDPEGLITYFNASAVELWGREPKLRDPVDRFCGSFRLYATDGTAIDHNRCWMALALVNRRSYNGCEIVVERPDGRRRTVMAYANPIFDGDRLLGAVNVLVDISERKRAEDEIARARDELEVRVRERTAALEGLTLELESFNYSVSHDLRAPLRGIDGFSRVLEEEYRERLDDTALGYLGRIRDGTRRMNRLIYALLEFSRLSQSQLERAEVDLSSLADGIARTLAESPPARAVTFVIAPGLVGWGDPELLGIALGNLLANAWKFTAEQERARIEFAASGHNGETVFFVRDDGPGFDMAYAERLFMPFQRLHAGHRFEGTGIGLATVRRIVNRHGGRIWAEAEPGRGATFFFTLPSARP